MVGTHARTGPGREAHPPAIVLTAAGAGGGLAVMGVGDAIVHGMSIGQALASTPAFSAELGLGGGLALAGATTAFVMWDTHWRLQEGDRSALAGATHGLRNVAAVATVAATAAAALLRVVPDAHVVVPAVFDAACASAGVTLAAHGARHALTRRGPIGDLGE